MFSFVISKKAKESGKTFRALVSRLVTRYKTRKYGQCCGANVLKTCLLLYYYFYLAIETEDYRHLECTGTVHRRSDERYRVTEQAIPLLLQVVLNSRRLSNRRFLSRVVLSGFSVKCRPTQLKRKTNREKVAYSRHFSLPRLGACAQIFRERLM